MLSNFFNAVTKLATTKRQPKATTTAPRIPIPKAQPFAGQRDPFPSQPAKPSGPPSLEALMSLFAGGGAGGGGGRAAAPFIPIAAPDFSSALLGYEGIYDPTDQLRAMYAAQLGGMNTAYDTALNRTTEAKGSAGQEIGRAHTTAQRAFNAHNTDFQQQASRINQQMAAQAAESQAHLGNVAAPIAQDLAAQGVSSSGVQQQLAASQAISAQNAQLQRELGARLGQVAAAQHRDTTSSGEMVNQGAIGTLENNYSDIVARVQAERAREQAAIQAAEQQALVQNQQRIAAQRQAIDQFNAQVRMQQAQAAAEVERINAQNQMAAAAAAQQSSGPSFDPLERALAVQRLQLGELDRQGMERQLLEAQRATSGSYNTADILRRLGDAPDARLAASLAIGQGGGLDQALMELMKVGDAKKWAGDQGAVDWNTERLLQAFGSGRRR